MNIKLKEFAKKIKELEIDGFLVTNPINISYLLNYNCHDSWLVVFSNQSYYITDSRYYDELSLKLKDVTIVCIQNSFYKTLCDLINKHKIRSLGYEASYVVVSQFNKLKVALTRNVKLLDFDNIIESIRQIKNKEEIFTIKKALAIHGKVNQFLKKKIKPGLTEDSIFKLLDYYVKSKNVKFSFDPIIASGKNSSYPHASISGRKIRVNDLVLVDVGVDLNGYKTDLTRIFFLGKIPPTIINIYNIVNNVQKEVIAAIKPGVRICDIDILARNLFKKNNLDQFFTHALGHGVGLEVHELPRVSSKNSDILKEGMIITIEPAVYFSHKFGIRIEDMVLITKKGCEVLSDYIN